LPIRRNFLAQSSHPVDETELAWRCQKSGAFSENLPTRPVPKTPAVVDSVARWYIFKQKIQIWVNFRRHCNGGCWYFLWPCCLLFGKMVYVCLLVHSVDIWYILPRFGMLYREKSGNPGCRTKILNFKQRRKKRRPLKRFREVAKSEIKIGHSFNIWKFKGYLHEQWKLCCSMSLGIADNIRSNPIRGRLSSANTKQQDYTV
jgi:hypothetical protein